MGRTSKGQLINQEVSQKAILMHRLRKKDRDSDAREGPGAGDSDEDNWTDFKDNEGLRNEPPKTEACDNTDDFSLLTDWETDDGNALPLPMQPHIVDAKNRKLSNDLAKRITTRNSSMLESEMFANCHHDQSENGKDNTNNHQMRNLDCTQSHTFGMQMKFEDVIPDYVSVDNGVVAYPLPFFTTPKTPRILKKSTKDDQTDLYNDIRKCNPGRHRDISFGEGLPMQELSDSPTQAMVILPSPAQSNSAQGELCRDRRCNLLADPDCRGFCLAHAREIFSAGRNQNDKSAPSSSRTTDYQMIHLSIPEKQRTGTWKSQEKSEPLLQKEAMEHHHLEQVCYKTR